MSNVKDTLKNAGEAVKEKAEEAACWAKDKMGMGSKNPADIQPHMPVISSCGCTMGKVDHVEGDRIKLTKNDSPDGQHHFVPTAWVDHVDNHVHLNRNADQTKQGWKSDAAAPGSGLAGRRSRSAAHSRRRSTGTTSEACRTSRMRAIRRFRQ